MQKRLILHDLSAEDAARCLPKEAEGVALFAASPPVHHCVGCFGCWVKTPGQCVIRDRANAFTDKIPQSDAIVFVSRCVYGGVSPDVKAVLDRSIGIGLPFFHIVGGEMHHVPRYENKPPMMYYFYNADELSQREKDTARRLAAGNARNWNAPRYEVEFLSSIEEIKGALS